MLAGLCGCPWDLHKACFCKPSGYNPNIDPEDFVEVVDNPYFPLVPGTTYVYEAETDEGTERVELYVTHKTKEILGVTCTVVRDTVTLDGELIEDTFDWFAQDVDGNVWYFGEASMEYEDDMVVSTFGSWEAGVDCAKPGIIMEAEPQVGDTYRQEFYRCIAEDMARVLALGESITVPYGSFDNCLRTEDFTPLDPEVLEEKLYAPGIGHILTMKDGERVEQLISITTE
jgi:hypothetical protein